MRLALALLVLNTTVTISAIAQWERTEGPPSGPTYTLISHQGVLLAGARGGLFRSTDDGTSWQSIPLDGIWTQRYVLRLASIDDDIFAVTENTALGWRRRIYRSTDEGLSWEPVNPFTPQATREPDINDIAASNGTLWAATNTAVYSSTDRGATWSQRSDDHTYYIAADGGLLLAASATALRVSTDSGITWQTVPDSIFPVLPRVRGVLTTNEELGVAVDMSENSGYYRSLDRGATWNRDGSGLPSINGIGALTEIDDTLYISHINGGIYRSTDRGKNWTKLESDGPLVEGTVSQFIKHNGILFAATSTGIFRASAPGARWTKVSNGLSSSWIVGIATIDGELYAGSKNGTFQTSDGGATWRQADSALAPYCATAFLETDSLLFAGTEANGVLVSRRGSRLWTSVASDTPRQYRIRALTIVDTTYFALSDTLLHISSDSGKTWRRIQTNPQDPEFYTGMASMGSYLFVSTRSRLYRSSDQGASWEGILTVPNAQSFWPIGTVFSYDSILLVGTAIQGMYRSTDSGSTWRQLPGFSQMSVGNFAVSDTLLFSIAGKINGTVPSNHIVFRSTDLGITWEPFSQGVEQMFPTCLAAKDGYIYAGTYYTGVWRRRASEPPSGVEERPDLDRAASIAIHAVPNPTASRVRITWTLPKPGPARLELLTPLGQRISEVRVSMSEEGWGAIDLDLDRLDNGVYYCRMIAGTDTATTSIVVLR